MELAGSAALRLARLDVRFHKKIMRRNLNGFRELLSIGLLVESLQDPRRVDMAKTPKRPCPSLIPKLKRGAPLRPLLPALPGEPRQSHVARGIPMSAKKRARGYMVRLRNARIADNDVEAMLVDLAKVVMKYQIRKK